jgi:uncharacterized protein YciW
MLVAALLTFACGVEPPGADASVAKQAEADPKAEGKAEPAASEPANPNALTPEEEALIAADVTTLSPEDRRKRGYALRKKIMQNPDSEAAKALEEARKAAEAGEIVLPGQEKKPVDNGVYIPAPEFMQKQDASHGEPSK